MRERGEGEEHVGAKGGSEGRKQIQAQARKQAQAQARTQALHYCAQLNYQALRPPLTYPPPPTPTHTPLTCPPPPPTPTHGTHLPYPALSACP